MYRMIFSLAMIVAAAAVVAAPPATPEQIEQAIRDLGVDDYKTREKASEFLWAVGAPAEPALRKALNSGDAEVLSRVRDLLDKIPFGITPDSPKKVVALITRARAASVETWPSIVTEMLDDGMEGLEFARQIASKQADESRRVAFRRGIDSVAWKITPKLIATGKVDEAEELLGRSAAWNGAANNPDVTVLRSFAATVRLRGRLADERPKWDQWANGPAGSGGFIDDKTPDGSAAKIVAAVLAKSAGDFPREAALMQSTATQWQEMSRFDARQWAELSRTSPTPIGRTPTVIQTAALKMAYLDLAGDIPNRNKARAEFTATLEPRVAGGDNQWLPFRALMYDCRPAEALAFAEKAPNYSVKSARGDILVQLGQLDEARKVLESVQNLGASRLQVQAGIARLLFISGDRDALTKHLASMKTDRYSSSSDQIGALSAIDRLVALGLMEAAADQAIAALEGDNDAAATVLPRLFPKTPIAAEAWYAYFMRSPGISTVRDSVTRIGSLVDQRLAEPAGLKELDAALKWAAERPANVRWRLLVGFGDAAIAAGMNDRAVALFQQSAQLQALEGGIRLGDYHAEVSDWKQAAAAYGSAIRSTPAHPAYLRFLAGLAQEKSGDASGAAMRLSGELLAGDADRVRDSTIRDEVARTGFCTELAKRADFAPEIAEAVRKHRQLLVDLSFPWSTYAQQAQLMLCRDSAAYPDFEKAADAHRMLLIRSLRTGAVMPRHEEYLIALHRLHAATARANLAAGKVPEAMVAANEAHAALPTTIALAETLVPELAKRGHQPEADAFYAKVAQVQDDLCKRYPKSFAYLGQRAWLAARCGRELDKAIEWALLAVKLAPERVEMLEVLSEVQFQRKDVDGARKTLNGALAKSPRNPKLVKLLKRVDAGDPTAPMP